jgi:hypothetical protein
MTVQYNGYGMMPNNLYDTFTSEDLIQSIQQFKQFTSYIPKTTENKFKYTGTEQNQIYPQKPVLQRSLIEGLPTPIFEYIGRMKTIEPRPDYVVGVDMTSNAKQQFKKEFG